jgi:hypothetical protein
MRILLLIPIYCCSIQAIGCIGLKLSVDELMNASGIVTVFRGKVIESFNNNEHQLYTNISMETTFHIYEMWKGEFTSRKVTIYQSTPCSRNFIVGEEYLIFAYLENDFLETDENLAFILDDSKDASYYNSHQKLNKLLSNYNSIQYSGTDYQMYLIPLALIGLVLLIFIISKRVK